MYLFYEIVLSEAQFVSSAVLANNHHGQVLGGELDVILSRARHSFDLQK